MRTIDRDGFGPAVRDDSENLKLYLARRVQQRTAKFRCRCYRRAGTWSSFDRGEKNAATAATAATATTDFDTEKRRETGSSTDLDAHGARKPGSSTGDDEIGKIRQQIIDLKRICDGDLITEDESAAKRKQLFGL